MVILSFRFVTIELLLSADKADYPVRSCGRSVKKNVKSCDLSVSDDDHILTRIGRPPAGGGRSPTLGDRNCGGPGEQHGARRRNGDAWLSSHLRMYPAHRGERRYLGGHTARSHPCRVP